MGDLFTANKICSEFFFHTCTHEKNQENAKSELCMNSANTFARMGESANCCFRASYYRVYQITLWISLHLPVSEHDRNERGRDHSVSDQVNFQQLSNTLS